MGSSTQSPTRSAAPFWLPTWNFAVHVMVGTLIFAVTAAPAILLNWAVVEIEAYHHTDVAIVWGLRLAEYAVFAADLVLLVAYLIGSLKRTIRHLLRQDSTRG